MGRRARIRQKYLPEKLLNIRQSLGLSQSEMLRRLGFENVLDYQRISEFELGTNEPPLAILLKYARVAGVHMEDLVDDELELPDKLPSTVRYEGRKRKSVSGKNQKRMG
ncbi:MAG TPA: helix-turn-helix transcriptional regulator [Pyrinomonadaceae bacterium]|nr:helix-turn-helix transcriptional regulator [Pyrinomonadaceae bacterium]